jgi:anti-anti-sigma factor
MAIGLNMNRITTSPSNDGESYTISVNGNFDFNLVKLFRASYSDLNPAPRKIIVDLRHTDTIDSAALGMLINMKKFLGKADGEIELQNCNQTVKRILSIARFDILFTID